MITDWQVELSNLRKIIFIILFKLALSTENIIVNNENCIATNNFSHEQIGLQLWITYTQQLS